MSMLNQTYSSGDFSFWFLICVFTFFFLIFYLNYLSESVADFYMLLHQNYQLSCKIINPASKLPKMQNFTQFDTVKNLRIPIFSPKSEKITSVPFFSKITTQKAIQTVKIENSIIHAVFSGTRLRKPAQFRIIPDCRKQNQKIRILYNR